MSENACTFADIGTKFHFFDYRDQPARKLSVTRVPEVYRPGAGWKPLYDDFDFLNHAIPVDEDRLNEMIARLEGQGPAKV